MPVLPEVGSITVVSWPSLPVRSRLSIIATPMRSFTEEIGLKNSSLARISAFRSRSTARRDRRTRGVEPMVWVTSS